MVIMISSKTQKSRPPITTTPTASSSSTVTLPHDLLHHLFHLIPSRLGLIDSIRFGAVCRSTKRDSTISAGFPWILGFCKTYDWNPVLFSSPEKLGKYNQKFEAVPRVVLDHSLSRWPAACWGCSYGWLMFNTLTRPCRMPRTFAFHPLTGQSFFLPNLSPDKLHLHRSVKVILSSNPSSHDYTNVIAVSLVTKRDDHEQEGRPTSYIQFARFGDHEWTDLDLALDHNTERCEDIIFYENQLHGVTSRGNLVVFDIISTKSGTQIRGTGRFVTVITPSCISLFPKRYLVEMHGDILLVNVNKNHYEGFRIYKLGDGTGSETYKRRSFMPDKSSLRTSTIGSGFAQSCPDPGPFVPEWIDVQRLEFLEGGALLVDGSRCKFVPSSDIAKNNYTKGYIVYLGKAIDPNIRLYEGGFIKTRTGEMPCFRPVWWVPNLA